MIDTTHILTSKLLYVPDIRDIWDYMLNACKNIWKTNYIVIQHYIKQSISDFERS